MDSYNRSINKSSRIILSVYICLIYIALADVFISDSPIFVLGSALIIAAITYLVAKYIFRLISGIPVNPPESVEKQTLLRVFALSSLICFAIMMLWFIGFRPGSFQGDCTYQLEQALTGKYTDWNPVWHTLLFYTIPLKLTGGKLWSMTFFQMIWFSLAIGYMSITTYEYAGKLWTIISFGYIVLNPYTGQMMLYPWKDSAFAITGLLISVMLLKILHTHGEWADKPWLAILLGFLLASLSIFRHNGVLFSIPVIILLVLWIDKSRLLIVFISFTLSMIIVKGPVYRMVNVEHTPQTVEQAVGLPMTILANVTRETPELLDLETAEFMYSIAPQETWENEYQLGNYGVVKYWSDINHQAIEDKGVIPIFMMALRSFTYSPGPAIKATLALTDIVYGIDLLDEGYIGTQIIPNKLGLVEEGNPTIASILTIYYKIIRFHGFNFLRQSACSLLIILLISLSKNNFDKNGISGLLPITPLFIYAFGTMLLLTSADSRFFYIAYITCPIYCLIEIMNKPSIVSSPENKEVPE